MVATHILQEQRAEALEGLRDTLAGLSRTKADAQRVEEIHARASAGPVQANQEYMTALYLREVAEIIAGQARRITALEKQAADGA